MRKDFVYLASASPRRRALLEQVGIDYRARPAHIGEHHPDGEAPDAYVLRLAVEKAEKIWRGLASGEERPVLGADTAVVLGEQVLGKPADVASACAMLAALSGRRHQVLTAVALRFGDMLATRLSASEVAFRTVDAEECRAYCATGEPFDKAGGYAIQGRGALFVERLEGSYSGVMGLPLAETASLLAPLGLPGWLLKTAERA